MERRSRYTTATATATTLVEAALFPKRTGEVRCCWCWFEATGMRSLPAGADDKTCARHVALLLEQVEFRRVRPIKRQLVHVKRV